MLFSSVSPRQRIVTLRACGGEEHRRLAGRVAGTDDVDVLAVRVRRFAARRAVGDALAGEPVEPFDLELPPRDAAGEDDRACPQDVAAVEVHLARRGVDAGDRAGDEDLGAEPPRLLQRAARELVARHARGEAEVVLDPRGRAGLAARRLAARRRSCAGPPRRRRRRPRGRRARHRRSPCRTRPRPARSRCRAARRRGAAAGGRPSCRRRRGSSGRSASAGNGPPHSSAASGASGVEPLEA